MGRGFRRRGDASNRRAHGSRAIGQRGSDSIRRNDYDGRGPPIERINERMEMYYNRLGIVPEEEHEAFWSSMKTDLPNSFRFAGSRGHALSVQRRLMNHYIPEIEGLLADGQDISPPKPVPWYPDKLAWSMTTPKHILRKVPAFASFQKFMVSENSVGNITRQEIVSMLPPLFMDVKPGMTVLDMCAAPGSKSTQIIEMIHGGEEARVRKVCEDVAAEEGRRLGPSGMQVDAEAPLTKTDDDYSDDGRSTGLLIANDKEYKRGQMLIHQCKRLNSPNLIVTNHDATMYPSLQIPSETGRKYLKFDRILADVPCSGDGTCRKNVNIWKDWQPTNSLGLHNTQVRILVRALQLLKVGGRVVYSTCSMNPLEDEAVVKTAIERCGPCQVELRDVSLEIPGLSSRAGLRTWEVMDRMGRVWESWQQIQERKEETEAGLAKLHEGLFPPNEVSSGIALERCVRIYPHLQDTGAFFVAVLEKRGEIKAKPEREARAMSKNLTVGEGSLKGDRLSEPTTIAEIAKTIANEKSATSGSLGKIDKLDEVAPPQANSAEDLGKGNAAPTTRQNMENARTEPFTDRKRQLEHEVADASMSSKRLKYREEPYNAAPTEMEDRRVHYPPPPGAELNTTEHHEDIGELASTFLAVPAPNASRGKAAGAPEEFFKFIDADHPELLDIYDFYKLSPRFPRDRFMVRNNTGQPVKAIYYASTAAREILTENEGKGVKFVHCGVKMFVKQDVQGRNTCRWRIQSEGLPVIEPWVGDDRVVQLKERSILQKLLVEMFPSLPPEGPHELGSLGEQVRELSTGCCILRVGPSGDKEGFDEELVLPLWKGAASLNLMLPKEERKAMLLRLFNDSTPLVDHTQELQRKRGADEAQTDIGTDDAAGSVNDGLPHASPNADGMQSEVSGENTA
ncbi:MAG: hypothetical protein M1828_002868 [Chrysothrix sp. TS-e1954]|nr:MAG: hypothetical protein M1828_002868 [Chrysothrix sp. TS-e1954]